VKTLKLFLLPFTGLKIGKHQFEYVIDNNFFSSFEYSLAKNGQCEVLLELEKQETLLILDFHVKGEIFLDCDKCLSNFNQTIDSRDRLIAKFSHEDLTNITDEVIVLTKNESEINIAPFIYEMINLAVPYVSVCENPGKMETCDKEILDKIEALSSDKPLETEDVKESPWDILKNIKN
jgi:uncharacterized protein